MQEVGTRREFAVGEAEVWVVCGGPAGDGRFVVEGPTELGSVGGRKQFGDSNVGLGALSPPTGNPGLDSAVLHRGDVRALDCETAARGVEAVEAGTRGVVGGRGDSVFGPVLWIPGVVEGSPDRRHQVTGSVRRRPGGGGMNRGRGWRWRRGGVWGSGLRAR